MVHDKVPKDDMEVQADAATWSCHNIKIGEVRAPPLKGLDGDSDIPALVDVANLRCA
jgi:hypothetical protein